MRHFQTAIVERKEIFQDTFATHPFECAWASEAIFFLRVEAISGGRATINGRVQISADGVRWIDEGTTFDPMAETGDSFVRVRHFGGWLRLAGRIEGPEGTSEGPAATLTVQLALKE